MHEGSSHHQFSSHRAVRLITSLLFALLVFFLASCDLEATRQKPQLTVPTPAQIVAPEVNKIATINGVEISLEQFNQLYETRIARLRERFQGAEIFPAVALNVKSEIANALIDEQLIEQAAAKNNLAVTEADIEFALKELSDSFPNSEAYQHYLITFSGGEHNVREMLRFRLLKEKLAGVESGEQVSDEEAKTFYDQHLTSFNIPAHLIVQDIVFLVGPNASPEVDLAQREKAEEVYAKAQRSNISFGVFARQYSEGDTAHLGGYLGRVTEKNINQVLWAELAHLRPGQYSHVIKANDGYHIVKLVHQNPEIYQAFEDVEEKIKATIQAQRRSTKLANSVRALRANSEITSYLTSRYSTADLIPLPNRSQDQSQGSLGSKVSIPIQSLTRMKSASGVGGATLKNERKP